MKANKASFFWQRARAMSMNKLSTLMDVFRHSPTGSGAAAVRSSKGGKSGGGMGGMQAGGIKGGGKRKTHVGSK